MAKITLEVGGMSCQHCVNAIERAVAALGAKGRADLANRTVEVEYDESRVSLDQVKAAIEDEGYEVMRDVR